jgi:hypothetical protein
MQSPPVSPEVRAALDLEHLRLLRLGYYISGAMTALVSCVFIIHATMFTVMGLNPQFFQSSTVNGPHAQPPPPGLFVGIGCFFFGLILAGWLFGALQIYAGICLGRRRHMTFIFVIAAIECLFLPWGTVLGVLTIIVLSRPSAAALFRPGGQLV